MTLLRWTVRIHKWLALIVAVQILAWVLGGLVMTVFPLEQVRGEHNIAERPPVALPTTGILPVGTALENAGVAGATSVTLALWLDQPVYRARDFSGQPVLIDAVSGTRLSPIDRETALRVARADYAGDAVAGAVEFFAEPTWESRRPGPQWRVSFDDDEGTRLYVSTQTGEVVARRNDLWRFYDFFWMLHIMDYEARENTHHPLIVTASGAALVVVLSGFVLLFIRVRRTILVSLKTRERRAERETR